MLYLKRNAFSIKEEEFFSLRSFIIYRNELNLKTTMMISIDGDMFWIESPIRQNIMLMWLTSTQWLGVT